MQWTETVKCWSQNKTRDHKTIFFSLRIIASLLNQTENVLPVQIRELYSTFKTVIQHTEVTTVLQESADSFTNCMSMAKQSKSVNLFLQKNLDITIGSDHEQRRARNAFWEGKWFCALQSWLAHVGNYRQLSVTNLITGNKRGACSSLVLDAWSLAVW